MLLKCTQVLKQLDGSPLKDIVDGEAVDATVRAAVVNALLAPQDKEKGIDKVKKYDLAMRVYKEDEVELSTEECALIKERVGELFAPLVVGQLFNILEGKDS